MPSVRQIAAEAGMDKAEAKALRRVYWRAFFRGFLFRPTPTLDQLRDEFWQDVERFRNTEERTTDG